MPRRRRPNPETLTMIGIRSEPNPPAFRRKIAGILLAAALGVSVWTCHKKGDEEILDGLVDKMIEAAGNRETSGILEHLSEDYKDEQGNRKEDIRGYLAYLFFQKQKLFVFKLGHNIRLTSPTEAESELKVVLAAAENAIPNERDAQTFLIRWRKAGETWQVVGGDHREMKAGDLAP